MAVLYFDNRSRDTSDAYLADGLTEQTIAQLGEVPRLTVSSRYAVRRFKGSAAAQDPAAIGRALNVTYLVNGSVQRAGSRLRVGVELLRAGTGVRVWGDQFDRTETDLLRLQDDIATAIATGIVGRLLPAERTALGARTTRNPAAYDQFLRGNFHLARRTPADALLAIRDYQAAIAADPGFVDALARVGYTYGLALDNEYDIGMPRDTMVARGLATARRAVALDSNSSDAWLALAYMTMGADPTAMAGARERFERAIRLNPRSAEAHHQFASFLTYMGDTARSVAENLRALELEPGRAVTWSALAAIASLQRAGPLSLALVDSTLAQDPDFVLGNIQRFLTALQMNDTAVARRAAIAVSAQPGGQPLSAFFGAYLDAIADKPGARQAFVSAFAGPPPATVPGNQLQGTFGAAMAVRLGDPEFVYRLLETVRPRGIRMHDVMRNPLFDPIRNEPRFQALFRQTMPPGASW